MAPRSMLRPLLAALTLASAWPPGAGAATAAPPRKVSGPLHPALPQGSQRDAVMDEAQRLHLAGVPLLATARGVRADVVELAAQLSDLWQRCQTGKSRKQGQALAKSPVIQKACVEATTWELGMFRARFPFLAGISPLPAPRRPLPVFVATRETDNLFSLHLHSLELVREGPHAPERAVHATVEKLVYLGLDCMRGRPQARRVCDDGISLDLQLLEAKFPSAGGARKVAVQKTQEEAKVAPRP